MMMLIIIIIIAIIIIISLRGKNITLKCLKTTFSRNYSNIRKRETSDTEGEICSGRIDL